MTCSPIARRQLFSFCCPAQVDKRFGGFTASCTATVCWISVGNLIPTITMAWRLVANFHSVFTVSPISGQSFSLHYRATCAYQKTPGQPSMITNTERKERQRRYNGEKIQNRPRVECLVGRGAQETRQGGCEHV